MSVKLAYGRSFEGVLITEFNVDRESTALVWRIGLRCRRIQREVRWERVVVKYGVTYGSVHVQVPLRDVFIF